MKMLRKIANFLGASLIYLRSRASGTVSEQYMYSTCYYILGPTVHEQ